MREVRAKTHRILLILGAVVLLIASLSPNYAILDYYNKSLIANAAKTVDIERQLVQKQAAQNATMKASVDQARAAHDQQQQAAQATKNATLTNPATSLESSSCNTATAHNDPTRIDVLVNKKHCIQPLSFVPSLVTASGGARLTPEAAAAFNQLYAAASAAGEGISVTSSYRSYTTQVTTYNHWVSISGKTGADTYSARPGYSEHQTGLALDVAAPGCSLDCFGSTSQYAWMQAHSRDYGFIQRYYKGKEAITGYESEEWHYRYVGVSVAKDMESKGIQTLEEYWSMSGGDY